MLDVCLILEGTYPYVTGGVATWVHQLISALHDIRFGIVHITTHADPTREAKYQVPANVVMHRDCYLHEYGWPQPARRRPRREDYAHLFSCANALLAGDSTVLPTLLPLFRGPYRCFDMDTLLASHELFEWLNTQYDAAAAGESYIDFFWTFRGMLLPLLQMIATPLPPAKIYHTISTGYAGLLACLGKLEHGGRCYLTEHGIYAYERRLEISRATWIYEQPSPAFRITGTLPFFKQWWITWFARLSQLTYRYSDRIFTLFEEQKVRQVLDGAAADLIDIIPNGIDAQRFAPFATQRFQAEPAAPQAPTIGLIGRVVPIKDVKTFVHAAHAVHREIPAARFVIVGPLDEEPDYVDECRRLTTALGLTSIVTFTGTADVMPWYAALDVVVLTSISEGQPYVVLEANAAGIPVVATDVGACRRLLHGSGADDCGLGPSGVLTSVGSPHETAQAILTLLRHPALYREMGVAGAERVQRWYRQDDLFGRYLNAYEAGL